MGVSLLFAVAQILGEACLRFVTCYGILFILTPPRWTQPEYDFMIRVAESEFYLQRANAALTHKLTHNRKRAGGGNGAESTIVSDFPE